MSGLLNLLVSARDLSASSRGLVQTRCERVAKSSRVSPRDLSVEDLVLTRCERVAKFARVSPRDLSADM